MNALGLHSTHFARIIYLLSFFEVINMIKLVSISKFVLV